MSRATARRICLVTPGHLTSTPRLLKEAAALVAAGYRVHLVSTDNYPPNSPLDRALLAETGWPATTLARAPRPVAVARRLLQRCARRLPDRLRPAALLARAQFADTARLARAAAAVPADYYIGHCLAALPAVAHAARRRGVAYGFDLEDHHETETPAIAADPQLGAVIRRLLRTHLPGARHLTAASPLIAETFARDYRVSSAVVLNVFPLDHAPAAAIDPGPVGPARPAALYWVSQVIGARRGLEEVVAALAQVRTPVELHLRGHIAGDYPARLAAHARDVGFTGPLRWLPFSPSREIARLAAGADLGLSTEEHTPLNRTICLANKVFVYLLAGVPQLMTDTRAHLALAPDLGAAGLVFSLTDPARTAAQIDAYFASPDRVAAARRHTWHLGQTRYNWEREQEHFLRAVHAAIGAPTAS